MKKKIISIPALVLVLVTAVVVLSSCGKKAEEGTAEMKIKFVNASGMEITQITLRERKDQPQEWITETLADGAEGELTFKTAVKDGAPDLDFSFNSGDTQHVTIIVEKGDKTITFKPDADGSIIADIVNQ